jgi:adenylate cyclase
MGKYIRIPQPRVLNPQTGQLENYKVLQSPRVTKEVTDKSGQKQLVVVKEPVYKQIPEIKIPIDEKGTMLINYAGPRSDISSQGDSTFVVRSLLGFIRDPGPEPDAWPKNMGLANKIVMTGVYATGLAEDERPTPFGLMYGVEINANAVNTIVMNRYLNYVPWYVNALILLAAIMLISLMTSRFSTLISLGFSLLLIAAFFIAVNVIFELNNTIVTFSAPVFGILLSFLAIVAYRVMTEERDKKRIKNMFGKYVSPTVVEQMMTNPPELGGVDKELTVFFSDIRGFTTLSESMSPQALVNHLNEYLTSMTNIIMEHYGTLDKYVGDEVMCFWGAPLPQEDHALLACKCAIAQLNALTVLNKNWPPEKHINIGIGINSGIMTVGNMGSPGRLNYTLMGDNVNLGARLEGTNKQYLTNCIISEYTYNLVKDKVIARELDNIRVKGKNKPVLIYELLDVIG